MKRFFLATFLLYLSAMNYVYATEQVNINEDYFKPIADKNELNDIFGLNDEDPPESEEDSEEDSEIDEAGRLDSEGSVSIVMVRKQKPDEEDVESIKRILYFLTSFEHKILGDGESEEEEVRLTAVSAKKCSRKVVSYLKNHLRQVILQKEGLIESESVAGMECIFLPQRTYQGKLAKVVSLVDRSMGSENQTSFQRALRNLDSINAAMHFYGERLDSFPSGFMNDLRVVYQDTKPRVGDHFYQYRFRYAGASIAVYVAMIKIGHTVTGLLSQPTVLLATVAGVGTFLLYQDCKRPGTFSHNVASWLRNMNHQSSDDIDLHPHED